MRMCLARIWAVQTLLQYIEISDLISISNSLYWNLQASASLCNYRIKMCCFFPDTEALYKVNFVLNSLFSISYTTRTNAMNIARIVSNIHFISLYHHLSGIARKHSSMKHQMKRMQDEKNEKKSHSMRNNKIFTKLKMSTELEELQFKLFSFIIGLVCGCVCGSKCFWVLIGLLLLRVVFNSHSFHLFIPLFIRYIAVFISFNSVQCSLQSNGGIDFVCLLLNRVLFDLLRMFIANPCTEFNWKSNKTTTEIQIQIVRARDEWNA